MKKFGLKSWFLLLVAIFLLMACSSMPENLQKANESFPAEFKQTEELITAREKDFQVDRTREEYRNFLAPYDQREEWGKSFAKAKERLRDARDVYEKKFKPLVDKGEQKDVAAAQSAFRLIGLAKKEADELAKFPSSRMNFIRRAKSESPQWFQKAEGETKRCEETVASLSAFVEGMKADHPQKKDDIVSRFSAPKAARDGAVSAFKVAKEERAASLPDYAKFADACAIISKNSALAADLDTSLRRKLKELNRSYSKTLVDMQVKYFVIIGRVSWDESSDWPSEHEYKYPVREVDETTYEYFDKLPDDQELADYGGFFSSSLNAKIDQSKWGLLQISPKENWPSSFDDEAQFFIADLPIRFFHKYLIVENGEKSETGWVEVGEQYFDAHDEHIGMDLIVKPYGHYEEETLNVASPAGLAYVGNARYGRWNKDPATGNSFWEFYGKYRLFGDMLGGNRYHRDEWDSWNRDYRGRKPYYGPEGEDHDRYGSGSKTAQTHYAGTHYAKTGGFKGSDFSVRSAGRASRGGGPGGGGK